MESLNVHESLTNNHSIKSNYKTNMQARKSPSVASKAGEAAGGRKHDEGDVRVAQHGELPGLLDDPFLALGVGELAGRGVVDSPHRQLLPSHGGRERRGWRRKEMVVCDFYLYEGMER